MCINQTLLQYLVISPSDVLTFKKTHSISHNRTNTIVNTIILLSMCPRLPRLLFSNARFFFLSACFCMYFCAQYKLSRVVGNSAQVVLKPACSATDASLRMQKLEVPCYIIAAITQNVRIQG